MLATAFIYIQIQLHIPRRTHLIYITQSNLLTFLVSSKSLYFIFQNYNALVIVRFQWLN